VDTYIRKGNYAALPSLPYTPGRDGAGIVEEVGEGVEGLQKGDRVYTLTPVTGTYAQLSLCRARCVFKLHPSLSFDEGAAYFFFFLSSSPFPFLDFPSFLGAITFLVDNLLLPNTLSLGVPYFTAHRALLKGRAKQGETLLVHGAT